MTGLQLPDSKEMDLIFGSVPPGYWVALEVIGDRPQVIAIGEDELEALRAARSQGRYPPLMVRAPIDTE